MAVGFIAFGPNRCGIENMVGELNMVMALIICILATEKYSMFSKHVCICDRTFYHDTQLIFNEQKIWYHKLTLLWIQ